MATTPVAPPDPLAALRQGLDIKITGTLPGETVFAALLSYATEMRATMDPALLKRFDAVLVQQYEDLQKIWRNIWVGLGVLK
jgi:hypothetical protein